MEEDRTQIETPNAGKITLTNVSSENQVNMDECNSKSQMNESSVMGNEIQAWTQIIKENTSSRLL